MEMDPVVLLAEQLRAAEQSLHTAVRLYEVDRCQENGETVNSLLVSIKSLHRDLTETMPTSALGASELVRLAAQRLPFSLSRYADHFNQIADRLGAGRREHSDLVWLRSMRAALRSGGQQGVRAAPLLQLAIAGAARPVVIFRSSGIPTESSMDLPLCPIETARRLD
ncbi:MAG TPA: hypothetical protein VIG39_12795 [Rhizomicrobium sp.]